MNIQGRRAIQVDGRVNSIDDRGFYISGGQVWHLYQDGIIRHGASSSDSCAFWESQDEAEDFLREWLLSGRQAEIDTLTQSNTELEEEREEWKEERDNQNKISAITVDLLKQLLKDDQIPTELDAFTKSVLYCKARGDEIERLRQKISEAMSESNPDLKTNILMTALNPREYELLSSTTRDDVTTTCDGSCDSAAGVCDCDYQAITTNSKGKS